jgi:hypothetical protein
LTSQHRAIPGDGNGRHRAPRRRRWLVAVAAASVLGLAIGIPEALAAVAPAPIAAANGSGGYDATNTNFTDLQAVDTATQYGTTVRGGAQGLQLCNGSSNQTAQLGLLTDNVSTAYSVASAFGTLAAPGCPTGGQLTGPVTFPALAAVPYGHHVWLNINRTRVRVSRRLLICIENGSSPTASPSATPTGTVTATATPTVTATPTPPVIPGFTCHFRTRVRAANRVVFEAQDLDAPTTAAPAGDQPGVQTRTVVVGRGLRFDHASGGLNANLTALTACSGNGFPAVLAGPAAYTTAACQPVAGFSYAAVAQGAGPLVGLDTQTLSEGISPNATAALVAPNNSLTGTSAGPHGTASDAATAGASFTVFTGNVTLTAAP